MQRQSSTLNPLWKVSKIVQENYRTADVFNSYGISFCGNDDVSLQEACQQKGIAVQEVEQALQPAFYAAPAGTIQYRQWKPEFLIDYIINIHHAYLKQQMPLLRASLSAYIDKHAAGFEGAPQLLQVFNELEEKLQQQSLTEETTVFPYLKQLINAYNRQETYGALFVKTMRRPLQRIIEKGNQQLNDLVQQLRTVTSHYSLTTSPCINYNVLMQKLAELDNDLALHKHLENNILYPKVLQMEKELLQL